ncbi:hypothetical protein ABZ566_06915, partial [Streptomyces hygroscopicus]
FLVPKAECADATAELPKGLRLIPVTTLKGAVSRRRPRRLPGRRRSVAGVPPTEPLPRIGVVTQAP